MVYIICVLIAVVSAFIGSLIGLGGGIILIPSLLIMYQNFDSFAWATPQMIVGISLIAMVFTAFSSTISYYKEGRVDYRLGLLLLTGSIPGGIFGSWLNQFVDSEKFTLYFGLLMITLSLSFLIKRKQPESKSGDTYQYNVSIWPAFIISLMVGILSGMFGIGGGSIMVPAMILLFGLPVHIATATSMFMILFISIISASTHIALGHVAWEYVFFFIPGAWIGGTIGAKINQKVKGNILEWFLRIILIVIGIRLIIDGIM
ncbi:sulfite exporter TauE/SafE family protein [Virgibacillus litoralis]|uniref:Probable membrane transporter protein n=1 Tax=Virgibacillus litoralis TaxID=578221 RepID=A0ABS4HGS3_9BACI|nr:sulfite exporter TauE/SafE family protein [Virgibacillus litoralis]MBP1950125.1 putative membrane protein YfcA [Virgibacillus litoralis]